MNWNPSKRTGLSWSLPDTRPLRVTICISALFLLSYAKVQQRPSSRRFHVPYVLHFLHTLGIGNSISRFTSTLFFLLFAILSLLSPVIYTFYLIYAFYFFFPQIPRTSKNIQQTSTAGKMQVCTQRHAAKFSPLENLLTEAWNFHRCLSSARIAWLTCSAVFATQNIFVDGSRCGRGFPFTAFENTNPHSPFQKRKTY